jgi:hypothetical protein
MIHVAFDKGTLLIHGNTAVPEARWDARAGAYRAMALHYRNIRGFLEVSGFAFRDDVLDLVPTPPLIMKTVLRDY